MLGQLIADVIIERETARIDKVMHETSPTYRALLDAVARATTWAPILQPAPVVPPPAPVPPPVAVPAPLPVPVPPQAAPVQPPLAPGAPLPVATCETCAGVC
jgi:hypothetical protein